MEKLLLATLLILCCAGVQGKEGRTYYDEAMMGRVRQKLEKYEWARQQADSLKSSCEWLLKMADQELWDFVPPPEQIRAINVCIAHDCPVCGGEITRKAGHYPWIMSRDRPFKVKCPVCQNEFPSNDFQPWNLGGLKGQPETGPGYVDQGLGWLDEKDGRRYYFVAYYIFWQRWVRDVLDSLSSLSQAYLLTDEPAYAHKCAVMLAKIASEYERFDYANQAYHEGISGVRGRISDYIWSTGNDTTVTLAYDAIYPALGQDQELLAFLKSKGLENPRELMETKLLNAMARDVMSGFVAGNMGMHQTTLCYLAIVLDNDDPAKGPTTQEMRDWIMRGPGRVEDLLWNGFWREGLGGESSPGYSSGWGSAFYEIARLLPRIGVDIWSNPKLKKMADVGLDLTVAGKFCPSIGDSGSLQGSGPTGRSAALQGPAFTHYHDPRHAQALALMGATSQSLFEDYFDEEEVAKVAAREGPDLGLKTRNLGGYGVAILESGTGENRCGVSMYYGDASGGHGHYDRLNIEMFAYGRPVLPEDGYPTPFTRPNFHEWRRANTYRHYCVMVDQLPHRNLCGGHLNTLAASPSVQLMDASAEIAYEGLASLYRRTTALISGDEGAESEGAEEQGGGGDPHASRITHHASRITPPYLLDIFRVRGGTQHNWCFHGPPFPEFAVAGGQPGPVQEKGTLAGEDVPYGRRPPVWTSKHGLALDLLQAKGLLPGEYPEPSKQGWAVFGSCVLTRKQGAQITVTAPRPIPAGKVKVFVRIYDYNKGSNVVDLRLGEASRAFRCDPSGVEGYRWLSEVYELPQPATEVVLTASELGQEYIQIDNVVLTENLNLKEPLVWSSGSSGFQGLFNVRRMSPEGAWSATWRQPDEDLRLTLTVPAGCMQEVILADGEPECAPGNPPTIQYVLGRNVLPDEQIAAGQELSSQYVAVIEPHRGAAAVTAVEPLELVGNGRRGFRISDFGFRISEPGVQTIDNQQSTIGNRQSAIGRRAVPSAEAVGLAVQRGRVTDLIHSSLSSTEPCEWRGGDQPFVVTGEFALVTVDDEGVQRACLVNGTSLRYGDFVLKADPSPAGKVINVDPQRNAITIDTALAAPEACRDAVVILGNELHQTSYTIQEARVADGGTTLYFGDVLFVIGVGEVAQTDQTAPKVVAAAALSGYGRIDGGRHAGRWLYNEDKSRGFRIAAVAGSEIQLEGVDGDLEAIFRDADGDSRRQYWISDIGPGDTFRIPTTTYWERVRPGE